MYAAVLLHAWGVRLFPALRHRNYRLFVAGQSISLVGTWMQRVALAWLVLQLTNSPMWLGTVEALQWVPVLLLSLVGGVSADRFSRSRLLMATQSVLMFQAGLLGVLVLSGQIRLWHVMLLVTVFGVATAFDDPVRHAFLPEMVGEQDIMNAVAVSNAIFNAARLIGPALAGAIIALAGIAWAFLANAVSFVPVIVALVLMRASPTRRAAQKGSLRTHLAEGLTYLFRTPSAFRINLFVGAEVVFLANFTVLVPLLAQDVLGEGPAGYGALMAALGAGGLAGALGVAAVSRFGPRWGFLGSGAGLLAVVYIALSRIMWLPGALALLFMGGIGLVVFTATANTSLQITTPTSFRGRVMAMYTLVMTGAFPVGATLTGTLAQAVGVRSTFLAEGALGLLATAVVLTGRNTQVATGGDRH
jgi:MFS family permease